MTYKNRYALFVYLRSLVSYKNKWLVGFYNFKVKKSIDSLIGLLPFELEQIYPQLFMIPIVVHAISENCPSLIVWENSADERMSIRCKPHLPLDPWKCQRHNYFMAMLLINTNSFNGRIVAQQFEEAYSIIEAKKHYRSVDNKTFAFDCKREEMLNR